MNGLEMFLFSVLRLSTPLIYAAMAAVISKKAGFLNLALESMMLMSAFTGVVASGFTGNAFLGLLGALAGGTLMGGLVSYAVLSLQTDLYLTCISVNMLSSGGTVFMLYEFFGNKSTTATQLRSIDLPSVHIPVLERIPFLGEVLSGHHILTYFAFLSVLFVWFLLQKTRLGLRIKAVGQKPGAAESVGINVKRIKAVSFLLSGMMASFAGAYMSLGYVSWFSRDMIAGRGFIGMAAMNITEASPVMAAVVAMVFAGADSLANILQMLGLTAEFVLMIPYLFTIVSMTAVSAFKLLLKRKARKKNI